MHFITKRSNFKYFKKLINTIIRYIFKRIAKQLSKKDEIEKKERLADVRDFLETVKSL